MKDSFKLAAFLFAFTGGVMLTYVPDWMLTVPFFYVWVGVLLAIASIFIKDD